MADLIKINPIDSCHILKLDQSTLKSDSKKLDGIKSFSIDFNELGINSSLKVGLKGQGLILHRDLVSILNRSEVFVKSGRMEGAWRYSL